MSEALQDLASHIAAKAPEAVIATEIAFGELKTNSDGREGTEIPRQRHHRRG